MKSSAFWTLKSSKCLDSTRNDEIFNKPQKGDQAPLGPLLNPPLYNTPSGTSSINVSVQGLPLRLSRSKGNETRFQVTAAFGSERMVKSVF